MATELDWQKTIGFILEREGGKVDNNHDRGGRTNRGITQATFDSFRKSNGLKTNDVFNITDEEVHAIYKTRYWDAVCADKLGGKYACVLVDLAVNSGVSRAIKYDKIAKGDVNKLIVMRKQFYNKIVKNDSSQKIFLKGWMNRIDEIEKYVAAWDLIKF